MYEVIRCLPGFTRCYRNGKLVKISWHWCLFKQDIRAMWDSWYLRNIGLPLLTKRLAKIKKYAAQLAGQVTETEEAAKARGTAWTPPAELIDIIKSANSEAVAGRR